MLWGSEAPFGSVKGRLVVNVDVCFAVVFVGVVVFAVSVKSRVESVGLFTDFQVCVSVRVIGV